MLEQKHIACPAIKMVWTCGVVIQIENKTGVIQGIVDLQENNNK